MASYCESLRVPLELEVQRIAESNTFWKISDLHQKLLYKNVDCQGNTEAFKRFLMTRSNLFSVIGSKVHILPHTTSSREQTVQAILELFNDLDLDRDRDQDRDQDQDQDQDLESVVLNLIQTTDPTICNSARVRFESTDRIFFKISWVCSQLPINVRPGWGTEAELERGLCDTFDFIVIDSCVHKLELLRSTICTRLIAQEIVGVMNRLSKTVWNCLVIYNNLSLEAKTLVKTHRNVNKFVEFYPLFFCYKNGNISLNVQERRYVRKCRASQQSDQKKYNAIHELLTRTFPDKNNAKIVQDNTGRKKFYFNIEWIWKKLPVGNHGKSRIFVTVDDLYKFLLRQPSITVFEKNSAHVTSILTEYPSENSVVREVLTIKQNNRSATDRDILRSLPSWCKTRVRSRNELNKFINMHREFLTSPGIMTRTINTDREPSPLMLSEQCSLSIHPDVTYQLLPLAALDNSTTSSENSSHDFYALAPLDAIDHDDNSTAGILDLDDE
jgi:hypothetical protein